MIQLKDLGNFQTIPPKVDTIINSNIEALNQYWSEGWNIEEDIEISKYICLSPLDCALIMESFDSVKWLVEHGVNLNVKDNYGFLVAVRYCGEEVIRYIVNHGAKIDGATKLKSEAFKEATYGGKYENFPIIHDLGHTVQKYGGSAFRSIIGSIGFDRIDDKDTRDPEKYEALGFFIENGVDINYNKPDQVYPQKPTPLCVAARYADLDLCKYLVEHGADVTMCESDGMRPYSIAIEKGDTELAGYFKLLEPAEYHNLHNKLDVLKPYKLPQKLIGFLQGNHLHLDLQNCDFEWIEFFSLIETVPMKIGRQKLLRISKTTGDYTHVTIVWNPKSKKIAYYDMEHEELQDISSFDKFMTNTPELMQKIIDGA